MAKLVYNLLSLQELRRRLKECHLSTQGPREQLIRRHQEFAHMYNAQCDSLSPKSGSDLHLSSSSGLTNRIREGPKITNPVCLRLDLNWYKGPSWIHKDSSNSIV